MNAVANSKQAKFIVDVSAESKHTRKSSVRFFSYDSKTAEIVIQAEKDNELIPRGTISNVEIYFESVNSSYRPTESLKWNDQMTINDDGLFLYTLTDDLLNYQGLVAFEVYINYINNDKSDSSNRIIYEQRTSAIDRAADEIEIVYIKDMETAKKEVADKAAEVKESLAGYDSGLDIYADQKKTEMDDFTRNVQETAINEIAMIQNELPKVKQVNVDETKKIKAEYPIVEQVATTEKEKIRAVLSTVDQTASEVSAYADRKISEYDAKFTQSNQKMNDLQQSQTELSNQLDETKKKVDAADVYRKDEVFNKPESSANVIDTIGGRTSATFKDEMLVNGTEAIGSRDINGTLEPFSQADYDDLNNLEKYVRSEILVSGRGAGIQFDFKVIEMLEKRHPWLFENCKTLDEKVTVYKSLIKRETFIQSSRGGGLIASKLSNFSRLFIKLINNTWIGTGAASTHINYTDKFVSKEYTNISYITNNAFDGTYVCSVASDKDGRGARSDGVIPAWVEVKDIRLIVELEVNGRTIIESIVAAYCRPLEQQLNDLAQKVAAMENK